MKRILSFLAIALTMNVQAAMDFNNYTFSPYGTGQNITGSTTASADGQSLTITGNAWRKMNYPYTITAETMLTFELSGVSGEMIAIGVDIDNVIEGERILRLDGSQAVSFVMPISKGYSQQNGDTRSYSIPLGLIVANETVQHLFFVCDDDATSACSATFKNVRLSENKISLDNNGGLVMGNTQKVTTYSHLQDRDNNIVTTSNSIDITGNSWRAVPLVAYPITSNTMLEFEFSSSQTGEIHGIGLDEADTGTNTIRTFKVLGAQTFGIDAAAFNQGASANGNLYQIPLGLYYNGFDANFLFFINDDDNGVGANSHYTNIKIYESN